MGILSQIEHYKSPIGDNLAHRVAARGTSSWAASRTRRCLPHLFNVLKLVKQAEIVCRKSGYIVEGFYMNACLCLEGVLIVVQPLMALSFRRVLSGIFSRMSVNIFTSSSSIFQSTIPTMCLALSYRQVSVSYTKYTFSDENTFFTFSLTLG